MKPLYIFIDTNVLMHAPEWKVRFVSELDRIIPYKYKIVIHERVFSELLDAYEQGGALGRRAKLAIDLSPQFESYEDDQEYPGTDAALLEAAKKEGGAVLTFDKGLKKRCKEAGVPVITIHGSRQLMIDGYLG
ncbi:MAG: hypothetical protein D6732_00925 [Methanobacteriota archaeon]|nr:MAG: hypothetical protein D6732_00925 [Euryarchaeota archaeon]